jgi:hypothetical protein
MNGAGFKNADPDQNRALAVEVCQHDDRLSGAGIYG